MQLTPKLVDSLYVEAMRGASYALRLTNPTPYRVAVALSVDGLNTIDARHTDDTVPMGGSETSPDSRYAGTRSPSRSSPKRELATARREEARRLPEDERLPSPKASYSTPV